jgi:hypothetical protein
MIEREMDDRGSKSKLSLNIPTCDKLNIVKEQRVDGSLCLINKHIRCILMGFERNYQVKIPSNQIRTFTSYCKTNKNCFDSDISLKQISEVTNFTSSPRLGPTDQGGKDLNVAPDPTGRGATASFRPRPSGTESRCTEGSTWTPPTTRNKLNK